MRSRYEKKFIRWGFKSKYQLPLFMLWREYRVYPFTSEDVVYAEVILSIG